MSVQLSGTIQRDPISPFSGLILDARQYGVTANGTTDDTLAIQSAATALGLAGGTILLPPGTIILSYQGTWNDSTAVIAPQYALLFRGPGAPSGFTGPAQVGPITLQGAAHGGTTLKMAANQNANGAMIGVFGTFANRRTDPVTVENIVIDGNYSQNNNQTLTVTGAPTGGTISLAATNAAISASAVNASGSIDFTGGPSAVTAAAVQTHLRTISYLANCTVTGANGGPWVVSTPSTAVIVPTISVNVNSLTPSGNIAASSHADFGDITSVFAEDVLIDGIKGINTPFVTVHNLRDSRHVVIRNSNFIQAPNLRALLRIESHGVQVYNNRFVADPFVSGSIIQMGDNADAGQQAHGMEVHHNEFWGGGGTGGNVVVDLGGVVGCSVSNNTFHDVCYSTGYAITIEPYSNSNGSTFSSYMNDVLGNKFFNCTGAVKLSGNNGTINSTAWYEGAYLNRVVDNTCERDDTLRQTIIGTGPKRLYPVNWYPYSNLTFSTQTSVGNVSGDLSTQTIALTGAPTGGTFKLAYGGTPISGTIAYNDSSANVQTQLRTIGALASVTVAGGPGPSLPWTVTMTGVGSPSLLTINNNSLSGGASPNIALAAGALTDSAQVWTTNLYTNAFLHIVSGTGAGQWRALTGNGQTSLSPSQAFIVSPDNTSAYEVRSYIEGTLLGGTNTTTATLTLGDNNGNLFQPIVNQFASYEILMTSGPNAGQARTIQSNNTASVASLTTNQTYATLPAAGDTFVMYLYYTQHTRNLITEVNTSARSGTLTAVGSATGVTVDGGAGTTNAWAGAGLFITGGPGAGQMAVIASNTNANPPVLTLRDPLTILPDTTSTYTVAAPVGMNLIQRNTLFASGLPAAKGIQTPAFNNGTKVVDNLCYAFTNAGWAYSNGTVLAAGNTVNVFHANNNIINPYGVFDNGGVSPSLVRPTSPAVPATTVKLYNTYGVNATVTITANAGGTTAVAINGSAIATIPASGVVTFRVPFAAYITLTYTSAPTWVWVGD